MGMALFLLGTYVDDLVAGSTNRHMLTGERDELCMGFEMADKGEIHYHLGMPIKSDKEKRKLTIKQQGYFESALKKIEMENNRPASIPTGTLKETSAALGRPRAF